MGNPPAAPPPIAVDRDLRTADGRQLTLPAGWELLPPGDAALTRRVKAGGPCWSASEQRGRRRISLGIWAPAARIAAVRAKLAEERADPGYAKRLAAGRARRAEQERGYAGEFRDAVVAFLAFAPVHEELAARVAEAIAAHATPVGSGSVARTKRIDLQRRAEAATIAWLRHQTTAYDTMRIPRVRGMRRQLRRQLAARSRELLSRYRTGGAVDASTCPLRAALSH